MTGESNGKDTFLQKNNNNNKKKDLRQPIFSQHGSTIGSLFM